MFASAVHRGSAVLRGGVAVRERCATGAPAGSGLRELLGAAPRLHEELRERGRASALLITVFATVVLPAWTGFDAVLESELVGRFALIRLLCTVPMLVALWLLWRRPIGRRRPQLITVAVLTLVQIDIAWMATQVTHVESYALGLSLALYGSGCILAGSPRWTGSLVALSWLALGGAAVLDPEPIAPQTMTTVMAYLATASLIAVVAHVLRQRVTLRELRARIALEHERDRTRGLLHRLEQLSHEDALTGLANRRRWDAELGSTCAEARERGTSVAVVLLDVDHFKAVNDRHGHAGGDAALRQVGRLLKDAVRGEDLVARLGGDELAVLLPGAELHRAVELAESLRTQALQLRLPGFEPGELTLSLGVCVAAGEGAYPLELMSCADAQLYRAKITRNCVGAPTADVAG
jgi:diguanylate cyclase (GGDEF)-like protein